jgi:hypothetical protein
MSCYPRDLPARVDDVPDGEGDALEVWVLVGLSLEGASDSVPPVVPGFSREDVAAAVVEFQEILLTFVFNIHEAEVFGAAQGDPNDDVSEGLFVLHVQSQKIPFFILVYQYLVRRVPLVEDGMFVHTFIDKPLQLIKWIMFGGIFRLKHGIVQLGLEVLDAVILLFSSQPFAPSLPLNSRQHFSFFLKTEEFADVGESLYA